MFKTVAAVVLGVVVFLSYMIVSHPNRRARIGAIVTNWCSGDRNGEAVE